MSKFKFDLTLNNKLGFTTTPDAVQFDCTTRGVVANPQLPIVIYSGTPRLVTIYNAPDSITLTATPAAGGVNPPRTVEVTGPHQYVVTPFTDDPSHWDVTITHFTGEKGYQQDEESDTTTVTVTDDQN